MGKIKVLDAALANMIAAGEVVERPSSIVKELVENSIDAGATEIMIAVKDGGRSEIEVRDNGCGMSKEDLMVAFTRHATSKISTSRDLFNIETLGFRGEALPSISAVAKVEVKSCEKGQPGWQIQVRETKITDIKPSEARVGTDITVRDVFYNTPARLKHLRSDFAEMASILDVVTNISFGYPNIKITLKNGDKVVFYSSGRGDLREIIANVYGLETAKQLIKVDFSDNDFRVSGYIGTFTNHRANRKYMNFSLNSRSVKIPAAQSVLIEAYQNYLPVNRYPIAVLNIEADPHLVDVNVHPSKREVRLSKDDVLYNLLRVNIRQALLDTTMVPKVKVEEKKEIVPTLDLDSADLEKVLNKDRGYEEPERILKEEDKSYQFEEVNRVWEKPLSENPTSDNPTSENQPKINRMRPVGQIHGTYIVAESVDGFYLIDQHAAMERINFEKFYESLNNNSLTTDLLIPRVIELSYREIQILTHKLDLLNQVGIKAEIFGNNALRVLEIPLWMSKEDVDLYVNGVIEQILKDKEIDVMALRQHAVATIACKASLKANHKLTLEEQQELLDRLLLCKNPHSCPHGRPVMIFYSSYELEKLFKRVM